MDTLHNEKKIYHRDLHLRNIMVDASTGLPVLIDFGKSIQYPLHDPREALDCDLDKAQFQSAKAKMRTYLQEHNKHGIDTKD